MIERFSQDSLTWINLKSPKPDEVYEIMNEFSIPPSLMTGMTTPVPRSESKIEDEVIKVILDFPTVKNFSVGHPHEVKFLIGEEFLITVQYEEMEALDRFKKKFEVFSTLKKASKDTQGAHLFIALMNELYNATESKLDYIESKLGNIEADIFKENEKQLVFALSEMSKKLISFRQTLKTHEEVFRDARPQFGLVYKNSVLEELENTHGRYFYIMRRAVSLLETLDDLRETNLALLTTKQNEIMKTLTIMAFITFPLTLMTSMFGMNTESAPIIGQNGDFWIIVSIMACATIGFFAYFKYKGWL